MVGGAHPTKYGKRQRLGRPGGPAGSIPVRLCTTLASLADGGFLPAEEHLLGGGHRAAGLDIEAQVAQDHLERGEAADDVDLVGVAHVADPDDLPLDLPLAADGRDAEPLDE